MLYIIVINLNFYLTTPLKTAIETLLKLFRTDTLIINTFSENSAETAMKITKKAYAKINLFLDVLQKREDGYHDIGTLFQQVGIHDLLHGELSANSTINLSCTKQVTGSTEDNLIYKAAIALQEHTQCNKGVHFLLEKKLPSGAGLGGGSADAAAALLLLNELWELNLPPNELEKISAPLGADIPFMIQGGSSFGEGIGDILYPTFSPSEMTILIVTPDVFISTPEAYASLTPSGNRRYISFKAFYINYKGNISADSSYIYNKFEESILPNFPIIGQLKEHMHRYNAFQALLSGSGSSVFGLFEHQKDAETCLAELKIPKKYAAITNFM